ncbi:MAG: proton-conducting transporter membrane subunit [Candidatus Omnitrophica bacterium]|nr:proton-conducting transporter membrane subunit [Candidatus Omnitrophota bacterium]
MLTENPLLLLICLPVAAGLFSLLLPDKMKGAIKAMAFLFTLACLALSVYVFIRKPLFWQSGQSTIFIADNLSSFIGMGVGLFGFLVALYSFGFIEKSLGRYFGYLMITLGSSFGVAFSNDLIALLVFWGVLAAMLYLMVNMQNTAGASAAAKKALIIIGGTDAAMMLGIGLIWAVTGTFSMDKIHLPLNSFTLYAAYFSIAIACFAKAGAMPFHSWLPDVAEAGPTPVTAYLPASLDKLLGIYMLAKASLHLFTMNFVSNSILALSGAATIIFAVVFALVQHDMKRLLGYHAVSQVGYMVLGIGTGSPIGIAGGLFHMLNHAVYKSCLFLSGGNVEKKAGTTDLDRLGGLARYMPVTFICFLVASLSISGIPPFNGFVSKWMIYQGIIESGTAKNPLWIVWLVAAMFGSALTVASFMKLLHAIFLGRPSKDFGYIKEAGFSMSFPVVILASVCFIFGAFAFLIPLPLLILPSLGLTIKYIGIWSPVAATILLLAGIIAGFAVYAVLKAGKFRKVGTFIGGEDVDRLDRVSGTEFYNTIKDIKIFGDAYKREEEKTLDLYTVSRKIVYFFTGIFQHLHNGILPTFMVWCLLGMIGMFLVLFLR